MIDNILLGIHPFKIRRCVRSWFSLNRQVLIVEENSLQATVGSHNSRQKILGDIPET